MYLVGFMMLTLGCSKKADVLPIPKIPTEFDLFPEIVGVGFSQPWGMAFPEPGKALITEKRGDIILLDLATGDKQTLTTISQAVNFGQGGLLDIVLHPNFGFNRWVYVTYARRMGAGGYTTALGRIKFENNQLHQFEELFVAQATTSSGAHFGSRLAFDNDGLLYFSIGDRGVQQEAQNLQNHIGCVLRLHDDGTVPLDNPFLNDPNALPEIFSYGHRNIQGLARHPETGEMWSHEHGPMGGDEINILVPGGNFGWPLVSFGRNYNGTPVSNDTAGPGLIQPIHYWTPSIAPCGMAFITGSQYPGWENDLFIGALVLQHLNHTSFIQNRLSSETRYFEQAGRIRNVAMCPQGYLYYANETSGTITRLNPVLKN
jgi:glucose/arabinose dehydrogenase